MKVTKNLTAFLLFLLVAVAATPPTPVVAQNHQEAVSPAVTITPDPTVFPEERPQPGLVVVFNRPVVVLRAAAFGYAPSVRAKVTAERIDNLISRKIYGPVATDVRSDGILITIGGQQAINLVPGDEDAIARKTLEETAEETVRHLKEALESAQLQNSAPYLLKAGAKSVGATVLYILLILLMVYLARRFRPRILALGRRLSERRRGLFFLGQLLVAILWVFRVVFWIAVLGITSEWLSECLKWFPYTRPWGESLQENLLHLVRRGVGVGVSVLPNLAVIAVIVMFARGVVGILKAFFSRVESGQIMAVKMDVEAVRATRRILTILVWLIAAVMIYPYIPGSSSAAFKGMSVFVGLLLSLGSSSVVSQFTSGLVLLYSRALRPGEYVRIEGNEGTVESLGFLSTKIRSPKNEEFHVPNAVILGTTTKNFSRLAAQGGLLLHTLVMIGYDTPWRQVHALLIEAARQTEGICPEPAPFVLQTALSDFYVEYQLNACLGKPQERTKVLAALHANIQDQFNQCEVQIMSPHYYVDIVGEKGNPVIVPREKWHTPPATRGNKQ